MLPRTWRARMSHRMVCVFAHSGHGQAAHSIPINGHSVRSSPVYHSITHFGGLSRRDLCP